MPKVLTQHLLDDQLSARGKYAVGELLLDHSQLDLTVVPKGTRGLLTAMRNFEVVFLFPHSVLPNDLRAFSDGHVRVVPLSRIRILGRRNKP